MDTVRYAFNTFRVAVWLVALNMDHTSEDDQVEPMGSYTELG